MTYFKETNADSLIKRTIFIVRNSQLFLYNFSKFLYIFTLFIHPSTLYITKKNPHSPDDGSAEPKCYSVDWLCFSMNPHFLFGLLVVNFSSQCVSVYSFERKKIVRKYLDVNSCYVCRYLRGFPRGVMVKAMDCEIVVREFVLQSCYYVHFRANTLGKGMNPLILPAMG